MKHILRIEVTEVGDDSAQVAVMIKGDPEKLGISLGLSMDKDAISEIMTVAMTVALEEKLTSMKDEIEELLADEKLKSYKGKAN